uniref:Putative Peptidase M16C like protein n=1 Tax=Magnetococcus massalia (strain MO-1) TaxID=451514 RepID=A0A1S7LDR2_MAGMO|nr:putative Peptidase M16C like protein [Candidatus Magnetococcus massalia]
MSHSPFSLLESQAVEALNLTVEVYQHNVTGARHLHLASEDRQNAFLVAFLTVPKDATGVAHILEHAALCGSERFPVRDPFFMMLRRTLATFMNAFTANDWTAYPFASQSRKDFSNLLDVYLDAAFFPNLDALDFAQEGYRIEPEEMDNPESPLVYKGVVFNEMKGAMSSPVRALWERLEHHLFPTITYHHNSGGDPACIPDLTWPQLKDFHATHYHPSNAIFMTFGDIPAAEHQAVFEQKVLSRFEKLDVSHLRVPDEQRYTAPIEVKESYAADGEPELSNKTHQVMGWLWPKSMGLDDLLQAHLLNGVLMDNSASPLLKALETSDLGSAPSPLCGVDDSGREMVFCCGLEGSEPERAEAVEQLILAVFNDVAENGVDSEQVEAVLHQLELSRREITGDGMPYGLKIMLMALPAALHGGDPVAVLNLEKALDRLREQCKDPQFIPNLVKALLLNNPHRIRLTMGPDDSLNRSREETEKQRLASIRAALKEGEYEQLVAQAKALEARQAQEDDPEILPKVTLEDVPKVLPIPEGQQSQQKSLLVDQYNQPTNGLVYFQAMCTLPELEPELMDLLPIFSSCFSEVGSGGRDYLQTQGLISRYTGGIGVRSSLRSLAATTDESLSRFLISSKALVRNSDTMVELMQETFNSARFDEASRIRELVAQMRAGAEMKVSESGHSLAMATAMRSMSPSATLSERWGGMSSVQRLKALDKSLDDAGSLSNLQGQLEEIAKRMRQMPVRFVAVAEERHQQALTESIQNHWQESASSDGGLGPQINPADYDGDIAWSTSVQVNYCARAHAAVPYTHADAPALTVLGPLLRNGYLHTAIREKGGAYGGGAGFDSDAGAFRFFSYRDPRLSETIADFENSVRWLLDEEHPDRLLEEAILGVVGSIDKPGSPAGEAKRAFHDALHGRSPEVRRNYRDQVLKVSWADLKRVAERYLGAESKRLAVVSNADRLAQEPLEGVETRTL